MRNFRASVEIMLQEKPEARPIPSFAGGKVFIFRRKRIRKEHEPELAEVPLVERQ